jgi:hypothetical protein
MYDALRVKFPLKSIRDLAWYDIIHAVEKYYDERETVLVEILIFRTFLLDKISRCGYFLFCLGRCLFSDEVVRSHLPDALTFGASYSSEHIWRAYETSLSPTKTNPRVEMFSRTFPMGLHLSADVVVIPAIESLAMLLPKTSLQIEFVEYAKTRIRPLGTEGRYSILRLLFVWVSFFVDRFEQILLTGDKLLEETWIERCGFVVRRVMKQGLPLPTEEERAEEWIRAVRMISFGSAEEEEDDQPVLHQVQQTSSSQPPSSSSKRGCSGDNDSKKTTEGDRREGDDEEGCDIERLLTMEDLENWSVLFMNDSMVWSKMDPSVRQFVYDSFSSTIVWKESGNEEGKECDDPETTADILDERVLSSDADVDLEGSDLSEGSLTLGDVKDDAEDNEQPCDETLSIGPHSSDDALSASLLQEDEESDAFVDKSSENTVHVGDDDIDEMDLRRIKSFAADQDEDQAISGGGPSETINQNQSGEEDVEGASDDDDEELARSVADDEEEQRKQVQDAISESQSRIHELLEEVLRRHEAHSSTSHREVQWKRFEDTNALDLRRSGTIEEEEEEEEYENDDDDDDDDDENELELELYDIPGIIMTESVDGVDGDSEYDGYDEYDDGVDVDDRKRPDHLDLDMMDQEVTRLESGDYLQPTSATQEEEEEKNEEEEEEEDTGISDAEFLELMKSAKYRADLVELVTETRAEFELEAFALEFDVEQPQSQPH